VLSLTQTEAVAKLKADGFRATVIPVASQVEKSRVIEQSPQPGVLLAPNGAVRITVSTGPEQVEVPNVRDFTEDSAREAIKSNNLAVGEVQQVDDPSLDKGKILETNPKAGEMVSAGSKVDLKVASGKVKVPNVVDTDRGKAQQVLTDNRLKYKTTFEFSDKPEGTVLSQTAAAGAVVDVDAEIVLVVAQAKPPTPTPSPTATATEGTPSPSATP
jgi:serine/threonine-protein kinase